MRIALVTGASSGLGREFVYQIARKEKGIEEIWVIARRLERLKEVQEDCHAKVRPIPMDLTEEKSMEELKEIFEEEKPEIGILVNAAGFGKIGAIERFLEEAIDRMIALNCKATIDMTLLSLPYMTRGSRILEISSTSAFQPFQYLNIYAASKAFIYRFARALRMELLGSGIKVTAVCPYWIKDTEFIPIAEETEKRKAIRGFPLASKKHSVAAWALRDSRLGLPVSTPGPVCFAHRIVAKFIPSEIMMWLWAGLRRV